MDFAAAQGISVAEPLGSHNLVAATVLDRYDAVAAARAAAELVVDTARFMALRAEHVETAGGERGLLPVNSVLCDMWFLLGW